MNFTHQHITYTTTAIKACDGSGWTHMAIAKRPQGKKTFVCYLRIVNNEVAQAAVIAQ
jgi:hypothetical protein